MQTSASMLSADPSATYDEDFVLWMEEHLSLLRSGQFQQLDMCRALRSARNPFAPVHLPGGIALFGRSVAGR
jgi:hypothetical protein